MKEGDLLFVYGTLRRGQSSDISVRYSGQAEYVGEDAITGSLFDISWFPGVKLEGDGKVYGDVFKLTDASIISRLDGYEGYPNLYGRTTVTTDGGLKAWVYTINQPCGENQRIASGDWVKEKEAA